MSKIRIFSPDLNKGSSIIIQDAAHVHKLRDVLRVKEGSTIYLFDGQGKEVQASISKVKRSHIEVVLKEEVREVSRPRVEISLAFPLLQETKVDLILQKGTELGVSVFLPYICQRNKVKNHRDRGMRWKKIIMEAVRQSGRLWIPILEPVRQLTEIVTKPYSLKLYGSQSGQRMRSLVRKDGCDSLILVIGPEGDFSSQEVSLLKEHGFYPVQISFHVLRSETAAIVIAALAENYLNED